MAEPLGGGILHLLPPKEEIMRRAWLGVEMLARRTAKVQVFVDSSRREVGSRCD